MAKWLRFNQDYDDRPHARQMVHYPKGTVKFVPEPVVERAIASGAASIVNKPKIIKDREFNG